MRFLEEQEQSGFFTWCKLAEEQYPPLKWIYSSQAGVRFNNIKTAMRAKRSGNRKGVPDIFLPYPCGCYCGLFIEMKRPKIGKESSKGVLSKEQKEFLSYLNEVGYKAIVCYGANHAIEETKKYLESEEVFCKM